MKGEHFPRSRRARLLGSAAILAASGLACATAGQNAAASAAAPSGTVVMNVFYRDPQGVCGETQLDPSKKARKSTNDRVRLMLHNQCTASVDVTIAFDTEFDCEVASNPHSLTLGGNSTTSIDCTLDYQLTNDDDYDLVLRSRTTREANPSANVLLASEIALEAVP